MRTYSITKDKQDKAIKKNRTFLTLYYLIGAVLMLWVLINRFDNLGLALSIPLLIGLLLLPFTWFYFDKTFKKRMSMVWEFTDTTITCYENEKVKFRTDLNSITSVKKIVGGYRIESRNGTAYILDLISDVEEFVDKLKKTV